VLQCVAVWCMHIHNIKQTRQIYVYDARRIDLEAIYSLLQSVAVCCRLLPSVAVCCSLLQCITVVAVVFIWSRRSICTTAGA